MTARPMTAREKIALGNTKTCLHLDTDKGLYWSTVMAIELQIVLDYLEEITE